VPANLTPEAALELLEYWPAWRILRAVRLEIGAGVVVLGNGWLARTVLDLCRLSGCLWLAHLGDATPKVSVDFALDPEMTHEAVRRRLPAQPDVVFVLGLTDPPFEMALVLARDRSTVVIASYGTAETVSGDVNFYLEAHRRGLRVILRSIDWLSPGAAAEWQSEITLLARALPALGSR
jgi:hypothetical protein